MVETDSSVLVQMAMNSEKDGSALSHLVEDLRILLSSYRIVTFKTISKLCNSASHELASFRMKNPRTQIWLGSVPNALRDHVLSSYRIVTTLYHLINKFLIPCKKTGL
jgi:hypothetical protein